MSMSLSSTVDFPLDDAQIRLAKSSRPESQDAKYRLVEHYRPLINGIVRQLLSPYPWFSSEQREDVQQAAHLGFLQALEHFDLSRRVSLGVYSRIYIIGAVHRFISREVDHQNHTRPFEVPSVDEDIVFDLVCEDEELTRVEELECIEYVRAFVSSLPCDHQHLVVLLYWKGMSQAEAAQSLGVSRTAVNKKLGKIHKRGRNSLARFKPVLSTYKMPS